MARLWRSYTTANSGLIHDTVTAIAIDHLAHVFWYTSLCFLWWGGERI